MTRNTPAEPADARAVAAMTHALARMNASNLACGLPPVDARQPAEIRDHTVALLNIAVVQRNRALAISAGAQLLALIRCLDREQSWPAD